MSDLFRIVSPCPIDRDELAALRRDEIERLAERGSVCAIIERDGNGRLRTADLPVRRRFLSWVSAAASMLAPRLASAQQLRGARAGAKGVLWMTAGGLLRTHDSLCLSGLTRQMSWAVLRCCTWNRASWTSCSTSPGSSR